MREGALALLLYEKSFHTSHQAGSKQEVIRNRTLLSSTGEEEEEEGAFAQRDKTCMKRKTERSLLLLLRLLSKERKKDDKDRGVAVSIHRRSSRDLSIASRESRDKETERETR